MMLNCRDADAFPYEPDSATRTFTACFEQETHQEMTDPNVTSTPYVMLHPY